MFLLGHIVVFILLAIHYSPIVVGDNCWFGANVSVMPGVKIGNGCVMGAGSVVTKDVPDNSLVTGVPGKVIKVIDQNGELED